MILAINLKEFQKIILYALIIIIYFVIMHIKDIFIKKAIKKNKHISTLNTLINILILICFLGLILLVDGINFLNLNIDYEDLINQNASSIIGTIICLIVATTILNTTKAILMRPSVLKSKRKRTLAKVTSSIIRYIIYIVEVIIILALWGINIVPVLTGLGIAGLVIGLGAQKLINDFISGVFIVFEHHYDIGDLVEIDGFMGEVIDIGLKTTQVKAWTGEVKIIANGNIDTLINYSVNNMTAVVEFTISYTENVNEVIKLLSANLPIKLKDFKDTINIPTIVGTTALVDKGITLRAIWTVKAGSQFEAERLMRKAIKEILEENNIEISLPKIVIRGE